MKKILGLFVVLLILGGTAFFFGWAQLKVPPGSYGVMRSKTHGVDPRLIREGEFRWVWYKLIPTNVRIAVFSPAPLTRSIQARGSLPSGAVYASAAGLNMDFSYEVAGSFSFTLKAEALPSLLSKQGISDQAGLEAYEAGLAESIEAFAVQRLGAYAGEGEALENIIGTGTLPSLEADILRAFPGIENLSCTIRVIRLPDLALYNLARSVYEEYLTRQEALLKTDVSASAEQHLSARLRYDELEKYGELLTKYPVLLQYLALERGAEPVSPAPPDGTR
ncbi:MAG: hypothetical protein LBP71_05430 [Spirochaetaceae bacterium]|jgi:hypothetical protein|nr:hypothetical protein [Spirochaetaceae bacterium]